MCHASCMINRFQLVFLARHLEAMIVIHCFLLQSCCCFSNVLDNYCISFWNYFLPYESIFDGGGFLVVGKGWEPVSSSSLPHYLPKVMDYWGIQAFPYHFWEVHRQRAFRSSRWFFCFTFGITGSSHKVVTHKLTSTLKCHPAAWRCHGPVRSLKCWWSEGVWDRSAFFPWTRVWPLSIGIHLHISVLFWGRVHVPVCFSGLYKGFLVTCSRKVKRKSLQIGVFTGRKVGEWKNGGALTSGGVLIPKFVVAPF